MPIKVKQEDGTEVDALTPDEANDLAEKRVQEEREKIEEEKQAEIDALEAEKVKNEEELEKLRNKDMNFENLRRKSESKEDKEKKAEDLEGQIATLNKKIDELAEQPKNDIKEEFIIKNIGEDAEKKKMFEHYYAQLGSEAKTKTEILKAAADALTLAGGVNPDAGDDSAMFSIGADQNYRQTRTGEPSEESKEIASKLGLSEEDRKKYGKKN